MATECQLPFSDEDSKLLDEARERSKTPQGLSQETYEKAMPEVREVIEQRCEKIAETRIEKQIEKGSERIPTEELTPEKVDSLFTKEYNEWRQEVRDAVFGHKDYLDKEPIMEREGRLSRVRGELQPLKETPEVKLIELSGGKLPGIPDQ